MNLTQEEQAFREEVRSFLENKFPKDIQHKAKNHIPLSKDDMVRWQKILFEQGWAAENWPVEYGGTGWTHTQKHIFAEECALAYAPEVIAFGMRMVAPVIFTYGTEEQKQRFLPDILASNVWWCQGYSEPNAGSDLASLKTTATRDGDDYIVNGTKAWTTLGHWADWIFCLVKTASGDVKAQESISFLLIDMRTPGVSVSPVITLDGRREVNEVHFDNVRVPVANRIGEEGKGWTYAKVLLTHERTGIARVAHSKVRLRDLKELAKNTPSGEGALAEDPIFRQKVADIELDLLALEYTELRTLAAVSTGNAPGPESSILKIKGSSIGQLIDELYLEVAGHHALPFVPEQFDTEFSGEPVGPWYAADTAPHYFNYRKTTIYGGSNEIQKNIISKFVLGL
ncbi:acyl-CoA dehydrogenase family protein [Microbulbifer sp. ARAS458-1]|uniref:acyl-CoA dehydrogenase family protein n=1 Tax=Microbulbifer sp. ARAS458-1 TaxID=3140242 RepID=UPI003877FE84